MPRELRSARGAVGEDPVESFLKSTEDTDPGCSQILAKRLVHAAAAVNHVIGSNEGPAGAGMEDAVLRHPADLGGRNVKVDHVGEIRDLGVSGIVIRIARQALLMGTKIGEREFS